MLSVRGVDSGLDRRNGLPRDRALAMRPLSTLSHHLLAQRHKYCLSAVPPLFAVAASSGRSSMSALPSRSSQGTGVISELALARAQRNTVLIVDDLFSSRLLIAEIVRQIDPKLNLELFDTPSRALEYARQNRVDMVLI